MQSSDSVVRTVLRTPTSCTGSSTSLRCSDFCTFRRDQVPSSWLFPGLTPVLQVLWECIAHERSLPPTPFLPFSTFYRSKFIWKENRKEKRENRGSRRKKKQSGRVTEGARERLDELGSWPAWILAGRAIVTTSSPTWAYPVNCSTCKQMSSLCVLHALWES